MSRKKSIYDFQISNFNNSMQIFSQFNQGFDPEIRFFIIAVFALIFGSFASLLSYRLANKEPIVFTRSKCANCGTCLKFFNLIPIFSWVFQRGKCSNCHAKISLRYPLIELSFLISFLTIYYFLDQQISWKMICYFLITGTLIVMCVIDIEQYFIPDSTQCFLVFVTVLLLILEGGTAAVLANVKSAFLYGGFGLGLWLFFYFAAAIEAIGVDDIKFFFVSGLMLGTENFLTFLIFSGLFGLLFGAIWQKIKNDSTFPFAPAICLSTFICLLFSKKINPVDLFGSLIF